ncbi:MAG: hypothetical protein WAN04_08865 [Candidatus Udaeobacter sp.]
MDQTTNVRALKFRALAEKRVSTVLKTVQRIGALSRRASYDYTPEQVAKMFKAMRDELDAAELKFSPQEKQQTFFRLD